MNTTTSSINFSRMIAIASFSALASSIAAVCTAADSTDAPLAMVANGVRNVSVNYADLNVSSPQGADALYTRI
jgi:UrcA family protein